MPREILALEGTGVTASPIPDTAVIVIPVVVHVVYNNEKQNISDKQILSQIEALNADFNGLNADLSRVPAYFKPLAASVGIRFELARVTPQGAPTNGINRVKTSTKYFKDNDGVKFTRSGGVDAWDPSRYMNIWVCDLDLSLLGYASFPGGPKDRDGVVIDYKVFGTIGDLQAPYNKGRTATHEVGHWLGLKHLWGDGYCGDDGIDDTPQQQQMSRGCPTGQVHSCGSTPYGDMYMNFMDFTNDGCMYMFTLGQRKAMRRLFSQDPLRSALAASDVLTATPSQMPEFKGVDLVAEPVTYPVRMFPNPVIDQLTIEFEDLKWAGYSVAQVFNHLGQQVAQQPLSGSRPALNLGNLKPGLYFVQLKGNGGETYRQKIVKQ